MAQGAAAKLSRFPEIGEARHGHRQFWERCNFLSTSKITLTRARLRRDGRPPLEPAAGAIHPRGYYSAVVTI